MTLPATYDLDKTTLEATGIIHPYCSTACQANDVARIDDPKSVEPTGGGDLALYGCHCEGCGRELASLLNAGAQ